MSRLAVVSFPSLVVFKQQADECVSVYTGGAEAGGRAQASGNPRSPPRGSGPPGLPALPGRRLSVTGRVDAVPSPGRGLSTVSSGKKRWQQLLGQTTQTEKAAEGETDIYSSSHVEIRMGSHTSMLLTEPVWPWPSGWGCRVLVRGTLAASPRGPSVCQLLGCSPGRFVGRRGIGGSRDVLP